MEADSHSVRRRWAEIKPRLAAAPVLPIAATITAEPLVPPLAVELSRRGVDMLPEPAPFNQVLQLLLADPSPLASGRDAVLLPRLEELADDPAWPEPACLRAADELASAIEDFAGRAATRLWVGLFPRPWPPRFDDARPDGRLRGWYAANGRLLDRLHACPSVRAVDVPASLAAAGESLYDARMWFLARQPYSEDALERIARGFARAITASRRPPRKVLALDADGVLWGGVLGEDGLGGIRVGAGPIGAAHQELQRACLRLRARGVLLALCSKNDAQDVWEVLERREEMVLRRDDISAARIAWRPKSDMLREICGELNVGTDAVVLLDDSPAEVAEVNANLPEALTLLPPPDIARAPTFLDEEECFDSDWISEEDRKRAERMAAGSRRDSAAARLTPEEYLRHLELAVGVADLCDETHERVVQLLQKTNQFNLTTRRHAEADLRALLARPGWRCHTMTVEDRYGEYGLTACAIAGPADGALAVDSLLLSCRVLGRGVEQALMAVLVDHARALGLPAMRAEFIPTAKNHPAAGYLPSMGFHALNGTMYQLNLAGSTPSWPAHIRRK